MVIAREMKDTVQGENLNFLCEAMSEPLRIVICDLRANHDIPRQPTLAHSSSWER